MARSDTYTPQRFLPIGDVARMAGVTVATVRNWEKSGAIVATRTPGGQRRFALTDVEALLGLTPTTAPVLDAVSSGGVEGGGSSAPAEPAA